MKRHFSAKVGLRLTTVKFPGRTKVDDRDVSRKANGSFTLGIDDSIRKISHIFSPTRLAFGVLTV